MDDKDFNMLAKRPHIQEDASFVHRVTSYAFTQKRPISVREQFVIFWDEFARSLAIPKPALAFAMIALMGFIIGALNPPEAPLTMVTPVSVLYETRELI